MTIKELYNLAVEGGVEDYNIIIGNTCHNLLRLLDHVVYKKDKKKLMRFLDGNKTTFHFVNDASIRGKRSNSVWIINNDEWQELKLNGKWVK